MRTSWEPGAISAGRFERRERLRLVAERRVGGGQTQRGVEVPGILGQDPLEERDGPGVLLAHEETRGLLEDVEEAGHVDRPRRVLAHHGRGAGADVAQARELPALVLGQGRPGPARGRERRDGYSRSAVRSGRDRSALGRRGPASRRVGDHVVDLHPAREDGLVRPSTAITCGCHP